MPPRLWANLDTLDTPGLVAALDTPNGWQRDMATQMLIWKRDMSCLPSVEKLAQRYGIQLNAYGIAVEQSTGRRVSELWLLVADPDGNAQQVPIQRAEPRWPSIDRSLQATAPVAASAPTAVLALPVVDASPGGPEQLTLL